VSSKSKLSTTGAFIVYPAFRIRGIERKPGPVRHFYLLIGSKITPAGRYGPGYSCAKAGFEFREQIVYFDESDYQAQIAALSPSRRVPLLIDEGFKIWDSLAICE